jgi:hypothetical protein
MVDRFAQQAHEVFVLGDHVDRGVVTSEHGHGLTLPLRQPAAGGFELDEDNDPIAAGEQVIRPAAGTDLVRYPAFGYRVIDALPL